MNMILIPKQTNDTDKAGGNVDSKTLAHRFERELADYLKSGDGCRDTKIPILTQGLAGKLISQDPFSEKNLEVMADNYSKLHFGYGKLGRKAFLDGQRNILAIINKIIQNQGNYEQTIF